MNASSTAEDLQTLVAAGQAILDKAGLEVSLASELERFAAGLQNQPVGLSVVDLRAASPQTGGRKRRKR